MNYRISVDLVQRVIIEGEGDLAHALKRVEQLSTGYISEDGDEVSSSRYMRIHPKLELLKNEASDEWVEVSIG